VVRRLSPRGSGADDRAWDAMMVAAQGGDASSYHRLLCEVTAWLRRYYARRLPPAMIDDVIQDTLIAIHEKRHTYDPTRPFGAWLAAIARYKWIDALRSLNAKPTEALNDDIPVPDHEEAITSAWSLENVMITDGADGDYQARRYTGALCPAAVPHAFDHFDKACWVTRDPPLKAAVDAALKKSLEAGENRELSLRRLASQYRLAHPGQDPQ
jgi:hypothetical protein